jgi:hypothetical protein
MMQPTARNPRGMSSRGNEFSRKIIKRRHPSRSFSPPLSRLKPFPIIFIGFILGLTLRACSRHRRARIPRSSKGVLLLKKDESQWRPLPPFGSVEVEIASGI